METAKLTIVWAESGAPSEVTFTNMPFFSPGRLDRAIAVAKRELKRQRSSIRAEFYKARAAEVTIEEVEEPEIEEVLVDEDEDTEEV